ncbi:MAG: TIGR04283 family arsenosugar biosynthesis glycosyltransferase [Candidatus Scalindua sp.]|nr:TIGR04283 family arsenosugar biosynthesis glycosyltransferase [Candidatus Scalindua sp.]
MMQECISIIIPTFNEEENIKRCLGTLVNIPGIEVIIVDGGSTDSTVQIARGYRDVKVLSSVRARSVQMNLGASISHGRVLLFLHADCILPGELALNISHVIENSLVAGGAFKIKLLSGSFIYRMIEVGINLRSRIFKLPYGDQGLFVKRSLFDKLGGFKKMTVCEDLDFVCRLRKYGKIMIVDKEILASVRRWGNNGFLRTSLRNQVLLISYLLGRSYLS